MGDNAKYNTLLRIVNFVPPMVVMGIIALPYYIYVFINCDILLQDEAPGPMFGVLCLVIHHILVLFLLWSFSMSIIIDPGRVPEWYARLEMERQGMHVPGSTGAAGKVPKSMMRNINCSQMTPKVVPL